MKVLFIVSTVCLMASMLSLPAQDVDETSRVLPADATGPTETGPSPMQETRETIAALNEEFGPPPLELAIFIVDAVEDFTNAGRRVPIDFFYITKGQPIHIADALRSESSQSYPYYDGFPLIFYAKKPPVPTEENPTPTMPEVIARIDSLPSGTAKALIILEEQDGKFQPTTVALPAGDSPRVAIVNLTRQNLAFSLDSIVEELSARSVDTFPIEGIGKNGERPVLRLAIRREENNHWRQFYGRRFSITSDSNAAILIYRPTSGTRPWRVLPILDL